METLGSRRAGLRQEELRALLAAYLLGTEVPSRLLTVRELRGRFGASVGAIHAALSRLEASGAVVIEGRRGSGMILTRRSIGDLWSAARGEPMVMALALPATLRLQGLATGLKIALQSAGMDAFLIFLRGSRRRLRALHTGRCHAVVMSTLAAREASRPEDTIALELPPGTWAGSHLVYEYQRPEASTRRLRVAIDPESADLQKLTNLEFANQDVDFVQVTYATFVQLVRDDRADAAVWDADESPGLLPAEVVSRPLSDRVRDQLGDSPTRATIVTRRDDEVTRAVIRECLANPFVVAIQQEVIAGRRVPEY